MTTRVTPFVLCAASCLALALSAAAQPSPAAAEPAAPSGPKPLADALNGESRAAYDSAKLLLQNGDAAGAIAKFQRAYALSGDARLLWNIAACEKALRHYASASRFVARYLNEGGDKLTAEARQSAETTQAALRAFYSEVTLQGVPEGANVSIDGALAGTFPLPEPLFADLGKRQLRVELSGYEPFLRTVDVPGAAPITLEVRLTRKKQTATLSVGTSEKAAVIALDGKVVGSEHWQGTVAAGNHVVRVTAHDKKPYETTLLLSSGSSRTLQIALQDARSQPLWPWLAGGAAALVGASIGGYFLLKPSESHGAVPQGELGNVQLPLGGRRR